MRYLWLIFVALMAWIWLAGCAQAPATAQKSMAALPFGTTWQPVAPHIAVRSLTWNAASGATPVAVVRADIAHCMLKVVTASGSAGTQAETVCPAHGAAINAGFFDEQMQPIGLLIAAGKRLKPQRKDDGWGMFLWRPGHAQILTGTARVPAATTQAVQCKPRLVIAGQVPTFKPQSATRRSAIGLDGHGHLYLAATDGALTLEEWAACLHDGLGCPNALNLDGGPSTQLALRGKVTYSMTGAEVPVFLTVAGK